MQVKTKKIKGPLLGYSALFILVSNLTLFYFRCLSNLDEIGVPFAITVDFDTLKDNTVTLRDRDSTLQIRLPKSDVTGLIFAFVHDKMTWEKATKKYPIVKVEEESTSESTAISQVGSSSTTVVEKSNRASFSRPAQPIL